MKRPKRTAGPKVTPEQPKVTAEALERAFEAAAGPRKPATARTAAKVLGRSSKGPTAKASGARIARIVAQATSYGPSPAELRAAGVGRLPVSKWRVPAEALGRARSRRMRVDDIVTFRLPPPPPPGTLPRGFKGMATDSADVVNTSIAWASQALYAGAFYEGTTFLGYPALSEMAQRAEYRRPVEVIAHHATRKWITFQTRSGEKRTKGDPGAEEKADKIKRLADAMERFKVRDRFRELSEHDGTFGRGHLYVDTGHGENADELKRPISGRDGGVSAIKFGKGSLKGFKTIEPVWCYPTSYNSNNPLSADWYNPQSWLVQSKQLHASRLLRFVAREVPDLLKPAYSFGGLSMIQMGKPYVDNWLRTRQSVGNLVSNFSVSGVKTDLESRLAGMGDDLFARIDLFNALRDNSGLMVLQNGEQGTAEEFFNVSTPLGTLDILQAQSQEHLSSVWGIPLVELLGISPHGLNASSEGEIRTFEDNILAYQEHFYRPGLERVVDLVQVNEFGAVDPDITFAFEPLHTMTAKEKAEIRKTDAETDSILVNDVGAIDPQEVRARVAGDPEAPYQGLDVNDMPEPPEQMGPDGQPIPAPGEEDAGGGPGVGPKPEGVGGNGGGLKPPAKPEVGKDAVIPFARGRCVELAPDEWAWAADALFENEDLDTQNWIETTRELRQVAPQRIELVITGEPRPPGALGGMPFDPDAESGEITSDEFNETDHPHAPAGSSKGGQFVSTGGGGGGSSSGGEAPKFKSKVQHVAHLLSQEYGTTASEVLEATGWPSVSMPAQAKAAKMHLVKFKDAAGVTKYKGVPIEPGKPAPEGAVVSKPKEKPAPAAPLPAPVEHPAETKVKAEVAALHKAAAEVKEKATPAEIEKAKSKYPLGAHILPHVDEAKLKAFNDKFAGEKAPTTEAGAEAKIAAFKVLQKENAMKAEQAVAAAMEKAKAQKAAQEAEAKANAEKNKGLMKELGINEQQAVGFNALAKMVGGNPADLIGSFKKYEEEAKGLGYPISGFQCALIKNYSGSGYAALNKNLRKGSWSKAEHVYVAMVNQALAKMPRHTSTGYDLTRGSTLSAEEQAGYVEGNVVEERAFTSTSTGSGFSGNTTFKVKAMGQRGASIQKLSHFKSEKEVLFAARTFFHVTKVEGTPGGSMTVHMEEMVDDNR